MSAARGELRAYGTADEHEAAHGLGPTGTGAAVRDFLDAAAR
ncbi:hypothetical protein [Saccharopolyspora pogona]|nr:hypothetical protein [Saccharopolyspora pogona]